MVIPDKNNLEFFLNFVKSVRRKIDDDSISLDLLEESLHSFLNNTLTVLYRLQKLEELKNSKNISESIVFLEELLFNKKNNPVHEVQIKNNLAYSNNREQGIPYSDNEMISGVDLKNHCWELAHCKEYEMILKLEQDWQKKAYWSKEGVEIPKRPQKGDIILYGAVFNTDKYSWIAPTKYCEILVPGSEVDMNEGSIWIGYHENWEKFFEVPNSMNWLIERTNLMPLWKTWKNYLTWVSFIPKALIIDQSSLGLIEDKIYKFAKHLKIIDSRFDLSLSSSEAASELPKNLHYIYSAINGHLLTPMKFSEKAQKNIINILANKVEKNKAIWLQELSIQEDEAIGIERKGRFRNDVEEKTDENIPISSSDRFFDFLNFAKSKENQILFWHKPNWIINPIDSSQSNKLPGGVIYFY